ncbi:hypothetical protein FRC09_020249 [Ceratobasidium sp. 395]|nr:hypothetical protein FRC09_020249 [Ceratobasidium sp. 395]
MTERIYGIDRAKGLSQIYGFLKGDYFLDRKKWDAGDKESMFNLYLDAAETVLINKTRSKNWLFFSNWGVIRGDLYRGEVTLGDLYSISPNDPSSFLSVKVKRNESELVVKKLQELFPRRGKCDPAPTILGNNSQMTQSTRSLKAGQQVNGQLPAPGTNTTGSLSLGLRTWDACGDEDEKTPYGEGDDVDHDPIPQVSFDEGPPVYFWRQSWSDGSKPPADADVDLIFTNYIGKNVPAALNDITNCVNQPANVCTPFTKSSLKSYTNDLRQDQLLGTYVRKVFPMPS